jgi:uncharacterized membrane protein YhaH (DUF805 family)
MSTYEQLMQEALQDNKKAYKELYSYAGSGHAEAQYYLALYYKEVKGFGPDSDYAYWIKKAKDNGYDAAQSCTIPEPAYVESKETKDNTDEDSNASLKKVLERFSFTGRANRTEYLISIVVSMILLIIIVPRNDEPVTKSFLIILIDYFWYSQCVRRLHDFGASGWYVLIPVISWIFAAFPKGDEGENEYGEAPK